ncbi:M20/M25/M40 family metallo-hydrolase [Pseudonocardia eucalypti]|uniref:M20/M25/M40 family metallo-hydrolase n=1 Tax=Pseudonocardia eucalypti TaxID=648755 RepID=A0ABP9PGG6_9PSEU|nr:acetylornithine deacetylase/succinyl-diaminopimelate desuccinylase-like protein [Pseudonocardia eucalypti]
MSTALLCAGAMVLAGCGSPPTAPSGAPSAPAAQDDRAAFHDLYQELVETNTTASAGDCTLAAQRMADRLKKAGYPDNQLNVYVPPDHPKEGGLIATLPGTDPSLKAVLLLAHIDVVEAKAEDWGRDPFKLIEKDGYYQARGANDDKAMAAVFTDSLIRYRAEGFQPKRTIKMALTCGEEGSFPLNGVEWLLQNHRDWIDAAFALNEGAYGNLDAQNNRVSLDIQAGEKVYQDFTLKTSDPGGHSSQPGAGNAIQSLARIGAYTFPVRLNEVTKAYLDKQGDLTKGPVGPAMKAVAANPDDAAAAATVAGTSPGLNATLRTTCVVTQIQGGHAPNALPQAASANVNCRILPATPVAEVQQTLAGLVNDPKVTLEAKQPPAVVSPVPAMSEEVLAPAREVSARMWPNVPLVPAMSVGATDGRYLNAAGIPTYGLSGRFFKSGDHHNHGLNEQIPISSLYESRDFLHEVVKRYTS